jgi:hypothetical protein
VVIARAVLTPAPNLTYFEGESAKIMLSGVPGLAHGRIQASQPICDDTDRKIAFFTLHTSSRLQRLTALRLRLGERLMFLRGYRPIGGQARAVRRRAELSIAGASAVQPFGELLLQICCKKADVGVRNQTV